MNQKNDKNKNQSESNDNTMLGCGAFLLFAAFVTNPVLGVVLSVIALIYYIVKKYMGNRLVPKEYREAYESDLEIQRSIEEKKKEFDKECADKKNKVETQLQSIKKQIESLRKEKRSILEENRTLNADTFYEFTSFDYMKELTSSELKNEFEKIKLKEKEISKGIANQNTPNKKHNKQITRAFNAEADHQISNVTTKNIDTVRKRIVRSFEQLNKLYEIDSVSLPKKFLDIKLEKLELAYRYQVARMTEKELLKAKKEEIREQQRAEQELQAKKKKIEKDEKQFNNELSRLMKYMSQSSNDVETQIYADKIKELQAKIDELTAEKEKVSNLEATPKAGFVYIISNIGSFGENIFKIGMTRRLEPMDRINELSSASVPFPFDVHALIFTEDAPALENSLHQYFRDNEVNKVNHRKEFFKTDIESIKELVHKEYDQTATFIESPEAEQYYETLNIENNS
ncbi:MAG: DUF4041 domain-containing protein [Aerococcus sanguinicola]|uniref:DUF4041 domain-containing protein n=1 Tax=Aerococcus sp. HMSC062A02 TaxID=1715105 RepID=UPI000A42AFBA|nr:DUF4041 domain-containing protein [Aerococcus sp. HMSC062A02]